MILELFLFLLQIKSDDSDVKIPQADPYLANLLWTSSSPPSRIIREPTYEFGLEVR